MAAFGKLRAVGRNQQRQMGKLRWRAAGGFEDEDVFESVGEMILPADDVGNAQVGVVRTGSQMISRHAVGAQQREVFNVCRQLYLFAVDGVGETYRLAAFARDA